MTPATPPPADDPDPDAAFCAFLAAASEAAITGQPLETPADLPAELAEYNQFLLAVRDARRFTPASLPATTIMPARLQPGGRVGRYEVVRQLGRGGAGAVFAARDPALDRLVALKVLHPALTAHPSWGVRFRTEGPVLARLRHPHVVQVYESGEADGLVFVAMELIDGPDLHAKLADGPLTARQAAGWVADLADAVAHAHAVGVFHRDLKPANVLLDPDGGPKVADFGLAAPLRDGGTGLTATGEVVGTPNYLAPEMLSGAGDARTDVYGLGAVLYECLTGRPPFAGSNSALTLMQVRGSDPAAPRAVNPEVPADLNTVCLKCLEKRPERRYPSAAAVAADLRAFLDGRPVAARPPGARERTARWVRRRPTLAAVLAVGVVAAVIGLGGWFEYTRRLSAALDEVKTQQSVTAAALNQVKNEQTITAAALEQVTKERAATAAALALADKRANQLSGANDALLGVFRDLNLETVRDRKITVERALADRLVALSGKLDGDALGGPLATAGMQYSLGSAIRSLGFPDQALPLHTAAHRTFLTEKGPDDLQTLAAAGELAVTLGLLQRYEDALTLREEIFRRLEAIHGPDAQPTLAALGNLISNRVRAGKDADSVALREDLLARQTRASGPDSPSTLTVTYNLAISYLTHNQPERAVAILEPTIERFRSVRGEDSPYTLTAAAALGQAYLKAGQRDKAITFMAEARKRLLPAHGPAHPRVLAFVPNLVDAYQAAGHADLARGLLAETADALAQRHSREARAWNLLVRAARAYEQVGDPARTVGWWQAIVDFAKDVHGAGSKTHVGALLDYGLNLRTQKRWVDAEPVQLQAHELATKLRDKDLQKDTAAALVQLYEGWGRPADAAKWAD